LLQDPGRRLGHVVHYDCAVQLFRSGSFHLITVACPDEEGRSEAGIPSGLEIDPFVAHKIAGGKVEAKLIARFEQKTGGRFAAVNGLAGRFRGDINALELYAVIGKFALEPVMDPRDVGQSEEAAADARLVGDQEQEEASVVQLLESRGGTGQENQLIRIVQVVALLDEGSVAVEKDGLAPRGC
jgi:hypothetical protein